MEIRWKPSGQASFLHAAEVHCRGLALADPRLSAALGPAAALLVGEMQASGLPPARCWRNLLPLSVEFEGRRQLAEMTVTKTMGRGVRFDATVASLSAALAGVESAGRAALPNLAEELALRERPLREQWEARGPGLLHQVARLTDERLLPEAGTVVLVHPALGGDGQAYLPYNQVHIEAVLANPQQALPEVVRLAWLVGQLQLDLPAFSEQIHADRLPHIARFALLPPILAAAEMVELAAYSPATLRLAIEAWRLPVPADVDGPALLGQWWQTCLETRPAWPVALAALDQMFG